MCFGCICGDNHTGRPWWPTEQRWDVPDEKIVRTECCYRRLPASETVTQLRCQEVPAGGFGHYQEVETWMARMGKRMRKRGQVNWFSYASYYDPTWHVECNPEGPRSCKSNKRFLRGVHLREPC